MRCFAQRQCQSEEHDAWFRSEVEQGMPEAEALRSGQPGNLLSPRHSSLCQRPELVTFRAMLKLSGAYAVPRPAKSGQGRR
jgi:hypothetical protein